MPIKTIEKEISIDYEFELVCSECGKSLDVVKDRFDTFYVEPCSCCLDEARRQS